MQHNGNSYIEINSRVAQCERNLGKSRNSFVGASAGWEQQADGADPVFNYTLTLENTVSKETKSVPFDIAVTEINRAHQETEILQLGT